MTKVEEVARAINAAIGDGDASLEVSKAFAKRLARAAIEALREPTPEMVAAADEAHDTFDMRYPSVYIWQAMIDAALGETDE